MNFNKYGRTDNLFDGIIASGYYNDNGVLVADQTTSHSTSYIPVTTTTYTISGLWYQAGLMANFAVYEWDSNKNWLRRSNRQYPPETNVITFTIGSDTAYITLQIQTSHGDVMLNVGSTALPFQPYMDWTNTPHYIHNTSTDTITTLPAVLYPNDTTATVGLKGNTVQSSTPSPDNPIMPQGTGERTGNLFDYKTAYAQYLSGDDILITPIQMTSERQYFKASEVGKTITISVFAKTVTSNRVFIRANVGGTNINSNTVSRGNSGTLTVTVMPTSTSDFFNLTYGDGGDYNTFNKFMVNEGSTALPYEPYGYKIPISNGGKNLFDKDSTQYSTVGYMKDDGTFSENNNYGVSGYIQLSPNTQYTVSDMNVNGLYPAICFYTENKTFISGIKYNGLTMLSFTTPINCKYVLISYLKSKITNIMLNEGSAPLPYEPYNRTTTPVYLGKVQTTRKIYKYTFTGQEDWTYTTSGGKKRVFVTGFDRAQIATSLCSHFVNTDYVSYPDSGKFAVNTSSSTQSMIFGVTDMAITGATDWTTYLAQQYANGTPVTIWYVLATETTGIVNEPLMKIGDYVDTLSNISIPVTAGANTLSVGTTVQPSEVTFNYKGWHPVQSAHERESGQWD